MTLRWTDEQLEAHRKRMGGAKGSQVRPSERIPLPAKAAKYKAVKTGKHASKKESRRAQELHLMEKAGTISDLQEQVRFELVPRQMIDGKVVERAIVYIADFVYRDEYGGLVCEDVKGYRTPVYKIKKKLLLFRHGIRVIET